MTDQKTTPRGPTVEFVVHLTNGHRGRRQLRRGKPPVLTHVEPGSIPRVTRLLALAHRMEELVREGHVQNYVDLARLGGVSRARLTQILSLLLLAPDLQEAILGLPRTTAGRDVATERGMRHVVREVDWERQREAWRRTQAGRLHARSARHGPRRQMERSAKPRIETKSQKEKT